MRLRPKPAGLARDERGVALVEFALVLPLLLLIFAVIVEGGRMMWSYESAIAGVRDAARYLGRVTPSDICDDASPGDSLSAYVSDDDLKSMVGGRIGTTDRAAFAGGVTLDTVSSELEDCVDGDYRVEIVGVAAVTAEVTIEFPFAGIFGLVGSGLTTVTTTITDRTRAFGS